MKTSFNILGKEFMIDKDRFLYNKFYLDYLNKALSAKNEFEYVYKRDNKSFNDVVSNVNKQGFDIIINVLNETVDKIIQMGF